METIERTVAASATRVWELWTTPQGIELWWAPDGFRTDVSALDLRVGGELVYTMTAIAPEMVEFLQQNGMPLKTESRKRFTELRDPSRIAYRSLIDFVPGHEPYEQLTEVDLVAEGRLTRVVMRVEPLHDEEWTGRLLAGRTNELENLARLLA